MRVALPLMRNLFMSLGNKGKDPKRKTWNHVKLSKHFSKHLRRGFLSRKKLLRLKS